MYPAQYYYYIVHVQDAGPHIMYPHSTILQYIVTHIAAATAQRDDFTSVMPARRIQSRILYRKEKNQQI
jgi:hypothetical protein